MANGPADKAVFDQLVLPAAIVRFFKGHDSKGLGVFFHFPGYMRDDFVKLLLGKGRQFFLRLPRVFREDSGVLHGKQVFVGNHYSRPGFRLRATRETSGAGSGKQVFNGVTARHFHQIPVRGRNDAGTVHGGVHGFHGLDAGGHGGLACGHVALGQNGNVA